MPNHLHGIIMIGVDGKGKASAEHGVANAKISSADALPLHPIGTISGSLGAIVQNFKSTSSRRINTLRDTPGAKLWQRNYFERVVRNDRELNAIRQYIIANPLNWESDRER